MHKQLNCLLKKYFVSKISVRNSALFINGAKATENFVYVTPYVNIPEILQNKEDLRDELNKRKINYNITKLEDLWIFYDELKQRKSNLDSTKAKLGSELSNFLKTEPESDAVNKLKLQIDLIKDNIKKLKIPLWSAEESVMVEALKLPNNLHHLTPDDSPKTIYTHLTAPSTKKDHLKIATELGLIHFKKNENYYLKGDAAIFELGAKFYFSQMLKKNKFIQFSNPDFVKSVIIEGCGEDHTDPDKTFILHHNEDTKVSSDSRLHLTGAGSLCSFMAYHAKNVIYAKTLPLKYFAMGRQYIPAPAEEDSLFHVSQSSVIQMFSVARDSEELNKILEDLTNIIKEAYSSLGLHFRLCYVSADKLLLWESLRLSIEMYSTSLQSYVEVGNLSISGDYISKRLIFTYMDKKQSRFPHLLSGTILNVPKLLACLLEQDPGYFMPKPFQVDNWSV